MFEGEKRIIIILPSRRRPWLTVQFADLMEFLCYLRSLDYINAFPFGRVRIIKAVMYFSVLPIRDVDSFVVECIRHYSYDRYETLLSGCAYEKVFTIGGAQVVLTNETNIKRGVPPYKKSVL